jgi:hypothetical protein
MNNELGNNLEGSFGYSEALATWSVRYLDPSGFECILSIQSESGSEALKKAQGAISHLTEAQCIPLRKDSHNNGNKSNGKSSEPTILVKPDGNGKNPVCPLHGVEMQKWSKNGRIWYSHRWNDGWCNGKEQ